MVCVYERERERARARARERERERVVEPFWLEATTDEGRDRNSTSVIFILSPAFGHQQVDHVTPTSQGD